LLAFQSNLDQLLTQCFSTFFLPQFIAVEKSFTTYHESSNFFRNDLKGVLKSLKLYSMARFFY